MPFCLHQTFLSLVSPVYRPDRWDNPPEAIANAPGVWGHLLTFLGGTRACIGYRFSLVECALFSSLSLLIYPNVPGLGQVEGPHLRPHARFRVRAHRAGRGHPTKWQVPPACGLARPEGSGSASPYPPLQANVNVPFSRHNLVGHRSMYTDLIRSVLVTSLVVYD